MAQNSRAITAPDGAIRGPCMLACRKLGDLRQTGYYYLSIPSGSCYCAPMICVLAPDCLDDEVGISHFETCSHAEMPLKLPAGPVLRLVDPSKRD